MTTETLNTYPHARDLNELADFYEQSRYNQYLEAGEFCSVHPSTANTPSSTSLGAIATGYMGPQHPSVLPRTEVK